VDIPAFWRHRRFLPRTTADTLFVPAAPDALRNAVNMRELACLLLCAAALGLAAAQTPAAPRDIVYEFSEPIPGGTRTQSGGIAVTFPPVAYPVSYYQVDVEPLNYSFTFESMSELERTGFIAVRGAAKAALPHTCATSNAHQREPAGLPRIAASS
jgi:hypothetical protein